MGLSRRSRNRRLSNRNILDVKMRTRGARLARVRLTMTALTVAVGMVAGLYGLWKGGEWLLEQVVFRNEMFAVQRIQVQSEGVIPPADIVRWSGVRVGDNLLGLDLSRVQRDLELAPLIRSAVVERVAPDTLRIRIVERVPIAQMMTLSLRSCGTGVMVVPYYLDRDGYVMDGGIEGWGTVLDRMVDKPLPVLEGVPVAEVRTGRVTTLEEVQAALQLVSLFGESAMAGRVVLEAVDLSVKGLLEARARGLSNGHTSRVRFGYDRLEEQMRRWRLAHDAWHQMGRVILTLDLSVRDNTPVVCDEAPAGTDTAAVVDLLIGGKECHV